VDAEGHGREEAGVGFRVSGFGAARGDVGPGPRTEDGQAAEATEWIQTFTGRRVRPLAMRAIDVSFRDIAHGLSHLCRFAGQTGVFYSVAQHSVYAAQLLEAEGAPRDVWLWGLFHDAAEAYISDVPRPVKALLPGLDVIEERILRAVAGRFGLVWPIPAGVWRVDDALLAAEAAQLMGRVEGWSFREEPAAVKIRAMEPVLARLAFSERYEMGNGKGRPEEEPDGGELA